MKIFVNDTRGEFLPFAHKFASEGAEVFYTSPVGEYGNANLFGLEQISSSVEEASRFCDFILSGTERKLWEDGKTGFFKSRLMDTLSEKENLQRTVELCGMEVNDTPLEREDCLCVVSGFVSGGKVDPLGILTLQDNWYLTGGLGAYVPSQGNIAHVLGQDTRLWQETFGKFQKFLLHAEVEGMVSIVCHLFHDRVKVCGVVHGLDIHTLSAFSEVVYGNFHDWLIRKAKGETLEKEVSTDMGVSIRCSVDPWPYTGASLPSREISPLVEGIETGAVKHLFLVDMVEDLEGFKLMNHPGTMLWSCGRGQDIPRARARAYRTLSNVKHPLKQYRTDVGVIPSQCLANLRTWGWI